MPHPELGPHAIMLGLGRKHFQPGRREGSKGLLQPGGLLIQLGLVAVRGDRVAHDVPHFKTERKFYGLQ